MFPISTERRDGSILDRNRVSSEGWLYGFPFRNDTFSWSGFPFQGFDLLFHLCNVLASVRRNVLAASDGREFFTNRSETFPKFAKEPHVIRYSIHRSFRRDEASRPDLTRRRISSGSISSF